MTEELADSRLTLVFDCRGSDAECRLPRSLVHTPCSERETACCWDSAGAGVTARYGRLSRASMTLPPLVLAGLQTGNRGTRRRAPVSDRPVIGLAVGSLLPR